MDAIAIIVSALMLQVEDIWSYAPAAKLQKCCEASLQGAQLLKWARENGCEWDSWTCASAASGGHLELRSGSKAAEVLKWARENGCEWNSSTCTYAAYGGHLELRSGSKAAEVLKWARENGCPEK